MFLAHWKLPYDSHRDLLPLIAECVHLDVALVFRFIKFYITVTLSDNMVVNYIANTIHLLIGSLWTRM